MEFFTKQAWLSLAFKELAGADIQQAFGWKYDPDIPLEAYYDASARPQDGQKQAGQLQAAAPPAGPMRRWRSILYASRLQEEDPHTFAKLCSSSFCDGLLYDMGGQVQDMSTHFLKNIQLENLPVYYRIQAGNASLREALYAQLQRGTLPAAAAIWEAPIGSAPLLSTPTPSLDNTALQAAGASVSLQIAHLLAALSAYLRAACKAGQTLSAALGEVLVVQAAEPDFYHEIAKLRALRLCMGKVAAAFGAEAPWAARFRILGTNNPWQQTFLEPSLHLLRNTTQALALVIGGVSDLLLFSHPASCGAIGGAHGARLALNISQLLRAEADMEQVADPAAGSYFFEHLTDALARKGWEKFQQIEARGGLADAAVQRQLLTECKAATKQTAAALAAREQRFLGVNAYVQASATPYIPAPTPAMDDLYICAYPSVVTPFETLRRRSDDFFGSQERPQLYVVAPEGGTHTARLRIYFQDLWGALGFAFPEEVLILDTHEMPLPTVPFVCVYLAPQDWTEAYVAALQVLLVRVREAQLPREGLSNYIGGLQPTLPQACHATPQLHYLSFPQDVSLACMQRIQDLLFDELS